MIFRNVGPAGVLYVCIAALALPVVAAGGGGSPFHQMEAAGLENYVSAVGRIEGGTLRVTLEAKAVGWQPWGSDGPTVRAHAFAADGKAARVPGPLIRVTAGTPVHITLRNALPHPIVVRGLRNRGQDAAPGFPVPFAAPFLGDSVVLAPGAVSEVRFTPRIPGSFFYYGRSLDPGSRVPPIVPGGDRGDGPFIGVLIVDPQDAPPPADERIFLITHWADRDVADSWIPSFKFMINGRSWPHTERLTYTEGDSVRWRVINASGTNHPMHLHGFFFRVDARGDQRGEWARDGANARLAVTENLEPGEAMRLIWAAEEPGNWIFHCHLMRHMSGVQGPATGAPMTVPHGPQHGAAHSDELMAGLVLGITVRDRSASERRAPPARRRLDLHATMRSGVFGDSPAYGFVLQAGETPPASDSVLIPGSPLVLTRDEPAEIMVHNRTDFRLGVHWHGLELESWADGVPGWSGYGSAFRPAIAPGDSFAVRMTPPRAGTFMYHVHSEPDHQLAQGLYGPLLVLEPGERWDPESDRLFVLGAMGAHQHSPPALNGKLEPAPIAVRSGATYRLRFMHISPDEGKRIQLFAGERPVEWRMVAKDGAMLSPPDDATMPAALHIFVGETYDFLWTPDAPGDLTLRISTTFDGGPPAFQRPAPPRHIMDVLVRVR